ncbi:hypothetical protein WJ972_16915 [Achromobacter insuavis]
MKDGKASHPTTLGDTLPDGFHDFYAAPQASPGCIVVQETDTVPHVHPDYGPGIFFTEDARIEPDAAPQTSAEDVRKVRADAFIAGFICAGGDAEEAKRQAPQFQACVDAGRKHQPQAAKDGGQQHPGDSNDREAWAADMLAAGAMHLGGDCWEWDVDDFEFRLWQVATRRTNRTAHAAIAKATPKDLP